MNGQLFHQRLAHQLNSLLSDESPAAAPQQPTTVDLTPEILKTREGIVQINELLAARDTANAAAAYLLKELFNDLGRERVRALLIKDFDINDVDDKIQRIVDAIHDVDESTNHLMRALIRQNSRIEAALDKIEGQKGTR